MSPKYSLWVEREKKERRQKDKTGWQGVETLNLEVTICQGV